MLKWLAVFFTLFIIVIIVLADTGNLGILSLVYYLPYGDKAGHFTLYGILAFLIDLALFRSFPFRSSQRIALVSGLILAVFIGLEEFSQQFFAERTFSYKDLIASYLGLIVFSWLALRTKRSGEKISRPT